MTCKPEMARPLTIKDIEELESMIDKYGVARVGWVSRRRNPTN